ncbi:MAG: SDR family oxidoreductase [Bacteroidales bacterium]|nr:SDR family oxidoreductase [Bacteroidales bacterium]
MKKVLITGSNGLLGQNLIKKIRHNPDYELFALSFSPDVFPVQGDYTFFQLDIRDQKAVEKLEDILSPDVIIHAAAMTQVDPCELDPAGCYDINVKGTDYMANLAQRSGAHFIYISSDFVFNGVNGPYSEDDQPDPVSVYGKSKLDGEYLTRELSVPWSIVRTILVYGVTPAMSRSNLVLWVKESLEAGKAIRVVDDQFRMPTLVDDLVDGIYAIMKGENVGIYHLSGNDYGSVYDFAKRVARFFKLDEALITPIKSNELKQAGKRPPDTGFILNKAIKDLNFEPNSFEKGLSVVQNLLIEQ